MVGLSLCRYFGGVSAIMRKADTRQGKGKDIYVRN